VPITADNLQTESILRVGIPTVEAPRVDQVGPDYRAALGALPRLIDQGNGMRGLLGLLISMLSTATPIVLIDEPEAFLHPPQARVLGRALAELAQERGLQVILATHDRNILTGLLEAVGAVVSVVRLERTGNSTMARQLDPAVLWELWEQPALEYTNILDGLFHRLVVLCEAEADCHFYAAAIDAAHADHVLPITPSDILFVPSFGKTGMAKLAYFLRATGVKVVATPDLDVLNDKAVIRSLVTALGSPWSSVEHTYDTATAQFRRLGPHRRLNRDVLAALKKPLPRSGGRGLYQPKASRSRQGHPHGQPLGGTQKGRTGSFHGGSERGRASAE